MRGRGPGAVERLISTGELTWCWTAKGNLYKEDGESRSSRVSDMEALYGVKNPWRVGLSQPLLWLLTASLAEWCALMKYSKTKTKAFRVSSKQLALHLSKPDEKTKQLKYEMVWKLRMRKWIPMTEELNMVHSWLRLNKEVSSLSQSGGS